MPELTLTISKDFSFDAAHHFDHEDADHPFSRLHGHSFEGTVTLTGERNATSGMVHDFWQIDGELQKIRALLDHRLLNEVEGLQTPSLENLAHWVFARLDSVLPGLVSVEIRRPSSGERAIVKRA